MLMLSIQNVFYYLWCDKFHSCNELLFLKKNLIENAKCLF